MFKFLRWLGDLDDNLSYYSKSGFLRLKAPLFNEDLTQVANREEKSIQLSTTSVHQEYHIWIITYFVHF